MESDVQSELLPSGVIFRRTHYEGDAHDQHSLEVQTSSGLVFDVLLDRALDIGAASYRGTSIAWTSGGALRHPSDLAENAWHERFVGGLIITCGLDNVGPACTDAGTLYRQHGQIGGEPAQWVSVRDRVMGGRRVLVVAGMMAQPGSALHLHRTLIACDDVPMIRLIDTVLNAGEHPEPIMVQYHCNFGSPVVAPGGRVRIPHADTMPRDAAAAEKADSWRRVDAPQPGEEERVLRHRQPLHRWATASIASPRELADGSPSVCVRYGRQTLPWLWQWRLLSTDAYVIGLEPANCSVKPRSEARRRGSLPMLAPGKRITFRVEIHVDMPSSG